MQDSELGPDDDMVAMIEQMIAGFQDGSIRSATLRVRLKDGSTETYQIGYETEAEKDQALARLLKLLNELH
jgi:hypothetical protein